MLHFERQIVLQDGVIFPTMKAPAGTDVQTDWKRERSFSAPVTGAEISEEREKARKEIQNKMNEMGKKIAQKRKDCGLTQMDFADKLSVTRQTVSRWEAGSVLPDIDLIGEIASLLGVSCDYLLKDEMTEDMESSPVRESAASRLLKDAMGKKVRFSFFDEEADPDLYDTDCLIEAFEGNWMKISAETKKKGHLEKLIPVSSVLAIEIKEEA